LAALAALGADLARARLLNHAALGVLAVTASCLAPHTP
jgi:hypothetical protein